MSGGISGGTLGTVIAVLEGVPKETLEAGGDDWALSPGEFLSRFIFAFVLASHTGLT